MKKYTPLIPFMIAVIAGLCLGAFFNQPKTEYLRIHIRADSNETQAQAVKYLVKDAVTDLLTPALSECDTKAKAKAAIEKSLSQIERTAENVLKTSGFSYGAKARINTEEFPTRAYGEVVLSAGYYDALIIELGSGKGDNWWCVVYPPLCFTGEGTGYIYKSKIAGIIKKFFGEE